MELLNIKNIITALELLNRIEFSLKRASLLEILKKYNDNVDSTEKNSIDIHTIESEINKYTIIFDSYLLENCEYEIIHSKLSCFDEYKKIMSTLDSYNLFGIIITVCFENKHYIFSDVFNGRYNVCVYDICVKQPKISYNYNILYYYTYDNS